MLHSRWLLILVIACGPRSPSPLPNGGSGASPPIATPADAAPAPTKPLDEDLDRLAERSVALYGEVVRAFDAAGENCPSATAKLGEITRTHADVIAANAKVLHEGREMSLKIALRRFDEQFQKAAKSIVQSKTVAACYQDDGFTKALDELVGKRP